MGMSVRLTKKVSYFIFLKKDAKYAKNINTDAKKIFFKKRRETRQRRGRGWRRKGGVGAATLLDLLEWW